MCAIKSKTVLIAEVTAGITTNANNEITGQELRERLIDIIESTFNAVDDAALDGAWIDLEINVADLAAIASTTGEVKFYDLLAGAKIMGLVGRIDSGDEFTGGAATSVNVEFGVIGDDYHGGMNVFNPTAATRTYSNESKAMYSWDATTGLYVNFASDVNLNTLTNGKLKLKINVAQIK